MVQGIFCSRYTTRKWSDPEPDGQPDPQALGDDQDLVYPPANDDEDGLFLLPLLLLDKMLS